MRKAPEQRISITIVLWAFPVTLVVKNLPTNAGDIRDAGSIPGSGKSPGTGHSNPLQHSPAESHRKRSLVGYDPQGHKELDTPEVTNHT